MSLFDLGTNVLTRFFRAHWAPGDARWQEAALPGMISEKTRKCLAFASAYWAYHLINPRLHDLGKSEAALLLAMQLAIITTAPTPRQIRQFREILEQKMIEHMHSWFEDMQSWFEEDPDLVEPITRANMERCWLEVDYNPDAPLQKAAEAAGLDQVDLRFPWKTYMEIEQGEVRVRRRGTCQVIYPRDKQQVKHIMRTVERYCACEA